MLLRAQLPFFALVVTASHHSCCVGLPPHSSGRIDVHLGEGKKVSEDECEWQVQWRTSCTGNVEVVTQEAVHKRRKLSVREEDGQWLFAVWLREREVVIPRELLPQCFWLELESAEDWREVRGEVREAADSKGEEASRGEKDVRGVESGWKDGERQKKRRRKEWTVVRRERLCVPEARCEGGEDEVQCSEEAVEKLEVWDEVGRKFWVKREKKSGKFTADERLGTKQVEAVAAALELRERRAGTEREQLRKKIERRVRDGEEVGVILGAGPSSPQRGWIATDKQVLDLNDVESFKRAFGFLQASRFLAEHVWEHLTLSQALRAARTCFRFIRSSEGGFLRVAVPDVEVIDDEVKDFEDGHYVQYSTLALVKLFRTAGFQQVEVLESNSPRTEIRWNAFLNETTPRSSRWGKINRSKRFDRRGGVSIIIDAVKSPDPMWDEISRAVRFLSESPRNVDAVCSLVRSEALLHKNPQRLCTSLREIRDPEDRIHLISCGNLHDKVQKTCIEKYLTPSIEELDPGKLVKVREQYLHRLLRATGTDQEHQLVYILSLLSAHSKKEVEIPTSSTTIKLLERGSSVEINLECDQGESECAGILCVTMTETILPKKSNIKCFGNGNKVALPVHVPIVSASTRFSVSVFAPLQFQLELVASLTKDIEMKNIESKSAKDEKMCFISIMLNGSRFLRHHITVFKKLRAVYGIDWEWHVVEGIALWRANRKQPYSTEPFSSTFVNTSHGTSVDGSSEYIDSLQKMYPDKIFVHRPPRKTGYWLDKLQMMNVALRGLKRPCVLVQLDVDELWSAESLLAAQKLLSKGDGKSCAYVDCDFFIAPNLVTTSKGPGVYSHDTNLEWLRLWWFDPTRHMYFWHSHAPPRLASIKYGQKTWQVLEGSQCYNHKVTEDLGIWFTHYAYVFEEQVRFKEVFYGYVGAFQEWQNLQEIPTPVDVSEYLSWISKDKARDHHVWADQPARGERHNAPVPLPSTILQFLPHKHLIIDGIIFQLQSLGGGISRVWSELLIPLSQRLLEKGWYITLLTRGTTFATEERPDYQTRAMNGLLAAENVRFQSFPTYSGKVENDNAILSKLCEKLGALAFISTWYSTCQNPSTESILMVHDMIPELFRWNLSSSEWFAKRTAVNSSSHVLLASSTTQTDFVQMRGLETRAIPTTVVPFAVNTSIFRGSICDVQERPSVASSKFLVVGERTGYKNGMVLFQSLNDLCIRLGHLVEVILVGGSGLSDEENEVVWSLPLGCASVEHRPNVSDSELHMLYENSAALAYLSIYEGFGLPVVEAMASCCPVVLLNTNRASLEVAGDDVAYVINTQTLTPDHVSEVLALTVQDPSLRVARISRGAERVREKYSDWNMGAATVAQIIERIPTRSFG